MDFLPEKIPVKSHALEIIKGKTTRDALVYSFSLRATGKIGQLKDTTTA